MLDKDGFNQWAEHYDKAVHKSNKRNSYPFAGSDLVRDRVCELIFEKEGASVLDLGFGTGKVTERLYQKGCKITGQDFAEKMLEIAKEKMPEARLFVGDFAEGLVEEIKKERYDFIIATYSLHHLTDEVKAKVLKEALDLLKEDGKIIIGDVAFRNETEMAECREKAGDSWDSEEIYFVEEKFQKYFPKMSFEKISNCAAVIIIEA